MNEANERKEKCLPLMKGKKHLYLLIIKKHEKALYRKSPILAGKSIGWFMTLLYFVNYR